MLLSWSHRSNSNHAQCLLQASLLVVHTLHSLKVVSIVFWAPSMCNRSAHHRCVPLKLFPLLSGIVALLPHVYIYTHTLYMDLAIYADRLLFFLQHRCLATPPPEPIEALTSNQSPHPSPRSSHDSGSVELEHCPLHNHLL